MSLYNETLGISRIDEPCRRFYPLDIKPLSLNSAYATMQAKGGHQKRPWMNKIWRRKTWEAQEYQWTVQDTMAWFDKTLYGEKLQIPTAQDYSGIALTMVFFIPPKELRTQDHLKFKGRDVSNYVKLLEDAVFEYLGRTDDRSMPQERAKIQDSASIEPLAFKRPSWDASWHIHLYVASGWKADARYVYHAGLLLNPYVDHARGATPLAESVRLGVGVRALPTESGPEHDLRAHTSHSQYRH